MHRISPDTLIVYVFSKPNQPNPSHFTITKEDAQLSKKFFSELDAEENMSVQAELQQTPLLLTVGNDGTDQQASEASRNNYLFDDLPANEAQELETQAQNWCAAWWRARGQEQSLQCQLDFKTILFCSCHVNYLSDCFSFDPLRCALLNDLTVC